jgi:RNA polymerase sigma-70 factor (ECF subfamily)
VAPVEGWHSIEAVYEAEFDNLWRSLRRLGVGDAFLEDAIQEVFLVAHARMHTFDRSRPLRPWLFGIAVRVAAEMRRRLRRAHPSPELAESIIGRDPRSPEEALVTRQTQALVDDALGTLDFDQRVVMVMHDLESVPAPAIAEALSLSVNTVYSRLRLARARVTTFLRRRRASP